MLTTLTPSAPAPALDLAPFTHHLKAAGRAARTLKAYASDVALFARWFQATNGRPLTPDAITVLDVLDYRADMLKARKAPSTINRRLVALREYARWAMAEQLIRSDPTEDVPLVEEGRMAPKWLAPDEQRALIRAVEQQVNLARSELKRRQALRDKALVWLLLNTGLRIGEACSLTLADLEIGERKAWLRVPALAGKGEKERRVPVNELALKALKAWLAVRPEAGHGHVFTGSDGAPLDARGVQHRLAKLGRAAGLKVSPHMLRHTFAKSLIERGATLEKVAALMGHASEKATLAYITPSEQDLEDAVALLAGGASR